jgi:hypothetical protein
MSIRKAIKMLFSSEEEKRVMKYADLLAKQEPILKELKELKKLTTMTTQEQKAHDKLNLKNVKIQNKLDDLEMVSNAQERAFGGARR